ncbi:MAG: PQQ-dependent sugar dehydrogenase, partial [Sphingobacteriales bacterium]
MKLTTMMFCCFMLLAVACSREDETTAEPLPPTPPGPSATPVETLPPNANYRPAFTGQTRINGMTTATAIRSNIITTALSAPWGITSLPDGRLLITEKQGRLRLVTTAGVVAEPISGLPAVNAAGQGGLLGLCLDPQFATNRMLYWSFSEPSAGGNVTAIAKGRLSDNDRSLENVVVIYRAAPAYAGSNHYGGRVIFDRTGNLIISSGERADNATRVQAQSVSSALGKIIRINRDGQPAAGNPAFSQTGARPELYSMGHRNPQGLAMHPLTGEIWQSEHGPRGGDEINRLEAGANYGWPIITYGLEYSGQALGSGIQQQDGLTQPVYYWDPV